MKGVYNRNNKLSSNQRHSPNLSSTHHFRRCSNAFQISPVKRCHPSWLTDSEASAVSDPLWYNVANPWHHAKSPSPRPGVPLLCDLWERLEPCSLFGRGSLALRCSRSDTESGALAGRWSVSSPARCSARNWIKHQLEHIQCITCNFN